VSRFLFPHAAAGASFRRSGADTLVVDSSEGTFGLKGLRPEVLAQVDRLSPKRSLADAEEALASGELAPFYRLLRDLARRRALRLGIGEGEHHAAVLEPQSERAPLPLGGAPLTGMRVLSRFASLRREGSTLVLESPCAHARFQVRSPEAVGLLARLAEPGDAATLARESPPWAGALLHALDGTGFLTACTEAGETAEDADPSLATWEFHDLLFHQRSRLGRHGFPMGGVYPFPDGPPPALKPLPRGERIPLAVPAPDRLGRDAPLSAVMDERRSVREYGAEPITLTQLGEFLHRVGRVVRTRTVSLDLGERTIPVEFAHRPYPSGGALYETELYVAARSCTDLARGFHYYAPREHALVTLSGSGAEVDALLSDASRASGVPAETIQVEIVLAARFRRMAWKYRGITYAAILKNVGVILEAMYLAATAMGLAPCALGVGNPDLFAELAGTDPHEEGSVGEFLLGSRQVSRAQP
jgi:SagB-type dehydrogenase family enzyme